MATFQNKATLSYSGRSTDSNTVTGNIQQTLTVTKTAVSTGYSAGSSIVYAVSLINTGTVPYTDLILIDDLGGFAFGSETLYPLTLQADSVRYFVNGVLQPAPAVDPGPVAQISGISVPAGGSALVLYETDVTAVAPLGPNASIVNTVTVVGAGTTGELTATETVETANEPQLTVTKALSPETVQENGRLTYTFTIQNFGNTAATVEDQVTLTDLFDPILTDLAVTLDGVTLTAPADYTYDPNTGEFATVPGRITVPAATFTRDPLTGVINTAAGTVILEIEGTV